MNRPATADLSDYGVIDVELTGTCPPAGQQIADLAWPPPAHLLALRRDGQIIPATPGTVLHKGDRLTILLPARDTDDPGGLPDSAPPRWRSRRWDQS